MAAAGTLAALLPFRTQMLRTGGSILAGALLGRCLLAGASALLRILRLASPVAGTAAGTARAIASSCTLSLLRCGMAATLGMRLLCLLFRLLLLLLGSLRSAFDVMMAAAGTGRCLSRRRTLPGCGF